jgi:autotransporter-associated beta strand protein
VDLSDVSVSDGVSVDGTSFAVAGSTTSIFSGTVTGMAGLAETGPGTLVLSGTNNYTGGTYIGGTVSVSNDANLGATNGTLAGLVGLDGGTLLTTSGITTSRQIEVSQTGTISVAAGQTSTFNGQFTGTGTLTVAGLGTVVLGNANNALSSGVTIGSGATLSVASGSSLGTGNLTINGGTLQTTGTTTVHVFGATMISGGATINVANAVQTTTIGDVNGTGGLFVTGSGTLELEDTNGYTGGTTVTGATLAADRDYQLGASGAGITLNGGTLATSDGLSTSRTIALGANGGTINGYATLSGTITGSGGLTLVGAGEGISLTGTTNNYSGGTTVTGGAILQIDSGGSLGASTSTLTLDNGTLETTSTAGLISRTISLGSGGGTIGANLPALTVAGKITGAGGLTVESLYPASTVTLSGTTNDYSGGTTVSYGSELLITNGASGSATGSGALSLAINATLGGAGAIHASSFSLQGNSRVIVGNGTDATSQMTLTGQNASTIDGAALTFNLGLGATSHGPSNQLNLGATSVTFTATELELNILGSGVIQPGTSYTLITFDGPIDPASLGLSVGANGQLTGGLSIANYGDFGASSNGYVTSGYDGSYLFIDGDSIDVMVVPEPSTWALFGMGFGLLAFVCYTRQSSSRR